MTLFQQWLHAAVAAGVSEPHAMVLSTVDRAGVPDTRVLILKDVDSHGFHFATESISAKGRQLAEQPVAALNFYWREQARQIRARGKVSRAGADVSSRDFLARPLGSRAASLIGRQSDVLKDRRDLVRELATARERLRGDPQIVAPHHGVYLVRPQSVEFWQGDAERRHVRLRYRCTGDGWTPETLWP